MTEHFHAVVLIDHQEATVFEFGAHGVEKHHIRAEDRPGHIHHKSGTVGSGHTHADTHFLASVAAVLKPTHEVLIVGHGEAKTEFAHYIRDRLPQIAKKIMGVEAVGNATEGEVLAFARKFFEAKDRTTPQF